jgi:metallo-beta-lactamase family protein
MDTLHITFWGGVGSVTGANFLLENRSTRILVDCGLLQGVSGADDFNAQTFPYEVKTIDYLFLTHAHMDHIGRVGKLIHEGFQGTIYSTPKTKELAYIMIADAVKIMEQNKLQDNTPMLYTKADYEKAFSLWKTIDYYTPLIINPDFSVRVLDAGHILGSSMYEFTYTDHASKKEKKIVFTGDSGNSPSPLLRDTDVIKNADYLIMDSVYGDRNHEPKDERDARFAEIIRDTIARGGTVVIPAFSLERTQVILYELNNLVEDGKIPSVPVFLDSPLGLKVTDIYKTSTQYFNDGVKQEIHAGDDIFKFPKLSITHSGRDSGDIANDPKAKIIIAGSGMSAGGRVVGHEARYITHEKNTILLMGYQAIGTLGRTIQNKPKEIEINGSILPVKARIEMISGYSSHKDSDGLVEMVSHTKDSVKKVFVVMGEPGTSAHLAQRLSDELGVQALYPERGLPYEL